MNTSGSPVALHRRDGVKLSAGRVGKDGSHAFATSTCVPRRTAVRARCRCFHGHSHCSVETRAAESCGKDEADCCEQGKGEGRRKEGGAAVSEPRRQHECGAETARRHGEKASASRAQSAVVGRGGGVLLNCWAATVANSGDHANVAQPTAVSRKSGRHLVRCSAGVLGVRRVRAAWTTAWSRGMFGRPHGLRVTAPDSFPSFRGDGDGVRPRFTRFRG